MNTILLIEDNANNFSLLEDIFLFDDIPARLRMQVIGTHGGVEAADFEFWCLAVSAVNGCGGCLASHERALRELGVGRDQIHEALRIASVVHAVSVTLVTSRIVLRFLSSNEAHAWSRTCATADHWTTATCRHVSAPQSARGKTMKSSCATPRSGITTTRACI